MAARFAPKGIGRALQVLALSAAALLAVPDGKAPAAKSIDLKGVSVYEAALERFEAGDLRTSTIHLKNILKEAPDHLPARILLGRIHLIVGDGESAEKELRRALELGAEPNLVLEAIGMAYLLQGKFEELLNQIRPGERPAKLESQVHSLRGQAHLRLRQLKDAELDLEAALHLDPDQVDARIGLARIKFTRGEWAAASADLEMVTQNYPDNAQAWFERGEMARAMFDLPLALRHYTEAISRQPLHLPARTYRAAVLIDLGAAENAAGDLEVVRQYDPGDPHLAYWNARQLAETGKDEEAGVALSKAADLLRSLEQDVFNWDPNTLLIAGLIFYAEGDTDLTRTYLGEVIRLDPFNPYARKALGQLLNNQRRYAESIEVLRPVVDLRPNDPNLAASLARALLSQKKFTEADELLKRALSVAPDRTDLKARLGLSHLGRGDRETGMSILEEAARRSEGAAGPTRLLIIIHLRAKEFDEAAKVAQAAIEQYPDNAELYSFEAAAHIGRGDREAARQSLEKAVALAPDHRSTRLNLASLKLRQGELDSAEADFRVLLERNSDDVRALLAMANIAERRGDAESELTWLRKANDGAPDLLGPKLRLIDAYLKRGEPEQAVLLAREARSNHKATFRLLDLLGLAELAAGYKDRAANIFSSMVNIARDSGSAMLRVARRQIQVEDPEAALRTLRSAAVTFPEDMAVLTALINLEYRLGRKDRARERILDIVESRPESPTGWLLLGDDRLRTGDVSGAVEAYESGFEKRPSTALLVRIYLAEDQRGSGARTIPRLTDWIAQNPQDRAVRNTLAGAYIKAGNLDAALRLAKEELVTHPDDPTVLNNIAWLYAEKGDSRALEMAEKAYALAPGDASIIDTYGWILVQKGEADKGLALLREAHARGGDKPEIRYHLAVALAKLGRTTEARRELQSLLREAKDPKTVAEAEAFLKTLGTP